MSLSHYASEYTSRKPECSLWSALSYYHAWSKTINADYHPLNARKPWINYPATAFVSSHLQSGQSVFEYGSGGSTIYFLDKGLSVTSIEHDSKWFDIISRAVGKHKHSAAWREGCANQGAEVSDWCLTYSEFDVFGSNTKTTCKVITKCSHC